MASRLSVPLDQRDQLVHEYRDEGFSIEALSVKYQCGIGTIYRIIDLAGCPRRRATPIVNEQFFKRITPTSAWVLGLWVTDGWISEGKGGGMIAIGFADYDLLSHVHNLMAATGAITPSPGRRQWVFTIANRTVVTDLRALIPQRLKADRTAIPNVPTDMLSHLVRGIIDGDGSFYAKTKQLEVGVSTLPPILVITYPSLRFLESLRSAIETAIQIRGRIEKRSSTRCYNLVYGSRALRILAPWVYQRSDGLRYETKHDKYLRLQKQTILG